MKDRISATILSDDKLRLIAIALESAAVRWRDWSVSIANASVGQSFANQAVEADKLAALLGSASHAVVLREEGE